ncbi:cytochrome c oxidase subunit II [Granulicella cerasi]|uniref:cytochrome-c oxidase n=1 Tax=Granulicella cerasi TaxID=741063 RepID=A0ABW1Z8H7_9BACT|nr:cytochrome C oxidase subunit II [Granulicella cerasi]
MIAVAALQLANWPLPFDAGNNAAFDRYLRLNLNVILVLFAVANVMLLVGVLLRKRKATPWRQFAIEYAPLTVFACALIAVAIYSEQLWARQRFVGAAPDAMQVEVTGVQFVWYFRYPGKDAHFGQTKPQFIAPGEGNPLGLDRSDPTSNDDIVTSELVLPAGREVDLALESQDVIHGFSVPELRIKQYATPGQRGHLHFTATKPGSYAILCANVCGMGHYRMTSTLRVVTPEEFAAWLRAHEVKR